MSSKIQTKRDPWFWILTIVSVFFLVIGILVSYYNTSDGDIAINFLYPLASNHSNSTFQAIIISTGLIFHPLVSLFFPISVLFNLMYFTIELAYVKRINYRVIPFLISVISIIFVFALPDSAVSAPKTNIGSEFYNIAQQIEIYVPELKYKKLDRKYALGECYQLMHPGDIEETEKFHEVKLPNEYAKLSATGKFYYRKFNGQTEFYFPQKDYRDGYQMGYLWLSEDNTSNMHNLKLVFQMRCGWHETFGKSLSG